MKRFLFLNLVVAFTFVNFHSAKAQEIHLSGVAEAGFIEYTPLFGSQVGISYDFGNRYTARFDYSLQYFNKFEQHSNHDYGGNFSSYTKTQPNIFFNTFSSTIGIKLYSGNKFSVVISRSHKLIIKNGEEEIYYVSERRVNQNSEISDTLYTQNISEFRYTFSTNLNFKYKLSQKLAIETELSYGYRKYNWFLPAPYTRGNIGLSYKLN